MEESKKRALVIFHGVMDDIMSRPPMDENEKNLRLVALQGKIDHLEATKSLLEINHAFSGDEDSLKMAQANGKYIGFFKELCNLQYEKDKDRYCLGMAVLCLIHGKTLERDLGVFESKMSEAEKVDAQLLAEGFNPDAMDEDIKNLFK